jgi:hypothetical protein
MQLNLEPALDLCRARAASKRDHLEMPTLVIAAGGGAAGDGSVLQQWLAGYGVTGPPRLHVD